MVTIAVPDLVISTGNATNNTATSVHLAKVMNWLTFSLGLPAIGLALYILKNLSKGLSSLCLNVLWLEYSLSELKMQRFELDILAKAGTKLALAVCAAQYMFFVLFHSWDFITVHHFNPHF